MTAFYYGLTVLIWGTTWIAIKAQLGTVALEVSIAYRFALAGVVLFLILRLTGRLQRIALRHQPFILLQAVCLFSCNFACFYLASRHMPSGLVSVVFSAATIFNMINAFLVHGRRPVPRMLVGAAIGVLGITCLFWETLTAATLSRDTVTGLLFALLGTWFFSVGNLVSARNQSRGIAVASANAYGMLYGAVLVSAAAVLRGVPFTLDLSPVYLGALVYLAVPGSVIGFTTYLTVMNRLGPEKASYMTVLFPVVALTVSVLFEHYVATPLEVAGFAAVLLGNVVVFSRRAPARDARTAASQA